MEEFKIEEVFNNRRIPVCFAANSEFVPYTAVMIQSIIDHASDDNNYDIVILYANIRQYLQEQILLMAENKPNISIRFFNILHYFENISLFTQSVYTGTQYTNEAYYRLLIPTIMPDYDKVLYFDGDMLALTDVAELYYSTDMTGYMLASSRDYAGISNCYIDGDPRREYREEILGLKNIDNYILSGMLVFNPEEFNKRYTWGQLLDICASRDWRQHDQDVLNVICEDSLLIIDGAWDYMEDYGNVKYLPLWMREEYQKTSENIKIAHYAGPRKPWKYNNSFKCDEFWLTCYKTPFFDTILKNIYKDYGYKNYILSLVFHNSPTLTFEKNDAAISNGEYSIGKMSDIPTKIEYLLYRNGVLTIDGYMRFLGITEDEPVEIYIVIDGNIRKCNITQRDCSDIKWGTMIYRGVAFHVDVGVDPKKKHTISFMCKLKDKHFIVNKHLRFSSYCALNDLKNKYYFVRRVVFTTDKMSIFMKPCGFWGRLRRELKFLLTIKSQKARIIRIGYYLHRIFFRKPIWLISDRYYVAGDNGEALFKYIQTQKLRKVKVYFVLPKNSPDYERMKKIGKVLDLNSMKYRKYKIYADRVISSHLDKEVCAYNRKETSDVMMHQQKIFLQHGITKDDVSAVYSKYSKNIDLFITCAPEEYESILNNDNYGLGVKGVKLTGFSRFDYLKDERQKIISILPTWRQYCLMMDKGNWRLKENFTDSEYYKFYYALLANERLQACAKEFGYKIQFIQHTLLNQTNNFFGDIDNVELVENANYSDIFAKTSLLVTDYSSTAFDVAYLRKPIIYAQFDQESFYSSHTYTKGYFDYKEDGFGEVCETVENTVDTIIEYIKNGCQMKPLYIERADNFFAYADTDNSQRILDEILNLKKK